ncbi:RB1-inducible coiled-coil protein 1 isoform X2 [Anoplophora glabripennis]|nr:RB1-inducible coiled-coil protein 1 isoform X2 [Anoplophora glabripennis]
MLFVFHVDTGTMMTFDMSLALESVENLKSYVEEACKIPSDKQVLLISGGECLDPNKRVCSYSAGTDTNPIFLFSKSVIESSTPPLPSIDYGSDGDLKDKLKECCDLPATLSTVTKRAQLAQQFQELAREQTKVCENLVLDQHLQQQGWSAVVANLEDITSEFKKRSEIFEKSFNDYMEERDSYLAFLKHFNDDLVVLQKIPILSALLELEKQNPESETSKTLEDNTNTSQGTESAKEITLLEWISSADSKSTMDQLYEHCSRGLEQFDAQVFKSLKEEIAEMLKSADNPQMKEVKGLGERLFGLETLMREAKKYVQQQADLAQSFLKNQSRANNLQDQSILPDLCASHRKQLQLIAHNHQQLCDIRRRCTKAKEELSVNLYHRLRWVMYIEDHILEIDQKLVIYHENLKRLRRHLEVLQQIHLAPATYLCAVAEVVRRRTFSQSFLLWASELACHLLTIHNEEVTRRKEFQAQFEGHFLTSLFPGMEDLPPSFATQAPSMFDSSLPKITVDDVDRLKKELPDLADNLNIPDTSAITNFFLIKSLVKKEEEKVDETVAVEEKLVQAVNEVGLASNLDHNLLKATGSEPCLTTAHGLPHLKDLDRGCESETDTEEFEKVGQSPMELHFDKQLPSSRPGTQDASTSTEDNLQISRSEHEKLKSFLIQMHHLAKEATVQLRSELNDLRTQVLSDKTVVSQHYESLGSSWENLIVERDVKEKELVVSIKKDHELTVNDFKKVEQEKNEKIQNLLMEKSQLEAEVLKSCENLSDLQETLNKIKEENEKKVEELLNQLSEKELEKERNIRETTERLNREHATELQNIRSRFKLMTMERSPTDSSLEWTSQFSSTHHNTLLAQMTENFEIDKEKAVVSALQRENEKWERLLVDKTKEMEVRFEQEKESILQDAIKAISEEKDKQIEMLAEREQNLNSECIKYKNTIQQLTESENQSNDSDLLDRINTLQTEKEKLEIELEKIKSEKAVDLSASVAIVEGKDATTSPIKQKEIMSRSDVSLAKAGKVNIESCKAGDLVLVLWDPGHESFQVLQENKHMYFLHSDYLEVLGLEVSDGKPNKFHCTGVVIDKEYCHARKSENRYRVPKGTKFFRVKVQPLPSSAASKDITRSLYHQRSTATDISHMSQSHSTISTITEIIPEDKTDSHSLPPSPTSEYPTILENKIEEADPLTADVVSVEKCFAEDSGIVDNIEQAAAALDVTLTTESNEGSDR